MSIGDLISCTFLNIKLIDWPFRVYYLPSVDGAGVVVIVVDSSVLVAAGSPAGAGAVVVVVDVDSWVLVAAGSSALLQPANKARVTKPVAIIALFFIVVSS